MGGNESERRWQRLDAVEDVETSVALGVTDKVLRHQITSTQDHLVRARTAALQRDRKPPASRDLRMVARSWGWLEMQVYPPVEPEPFRALAIGVAAPGRCPTLDMADSHHLPGWVQSVP